MKEIEQKIAEKQEEIRILNLEIKDLKLRSELFKKRIQKIQDNLTNERVDLEHRLDKLNEEYEVLTDKLNYYEQNRYSFE